MTQTHTKLAITLFWNNDQAWNMQGDVPGDA